MNVNSHSAAPIGRTEIDPRVRSHSVVLVFLLAFAALTWQMPFGATFLVALAASLTLTKAPRWWRALAGSVALAGFMFGTAWTIYLFMAY